MFIAHNPSWFASILMVGLLLTSTYTFGAWRPEDTVESRLNDAPVIDQIYPPAVDIGSPDTDMIIVGQNFGFSDTRVRLRNDEIDQLFEPVEVVDEAIALTIPGSYLASATTYTITVKVCIIDLVPPVPCEEYVESNPVLFRVFEFIRFFFPTIIR